MPRDGVFGHFPGFGQRVAVGDAAGQSGHDGGETALGLWAQNNVEVKPRLLHVARAIGSDIRHRVNRGAFSRIFAAFPSKSPTAGSICAGATFISQRKRSGPREVKLGLPSGETGRRYSKSASLKPAIFIKYLSNPNLSAAFPWMGIERRTTEPSFPYIMMAAVNAQQAPAVAFHELGKLLAGDGLHTAISTTRSPFPGFVSAISTERHPSTAS